MSRRQFGELVEDDSVLVCPGVHDPLTARAAATADPEAIYVTGYGTSLSVTGYPDVGLTTMSGTVTNANNVCESVDDSVIYEAGDGFIVKALAGSDGKVGDFFAGLKEMLGDPRSDKHGAADDYRRRGYSVLSCTCRRW
ncbi:isocitrate lyase/phosphoenolpyruvate mutase family protein [Halomarina pelagica]|uniref:isocitrate lyase/phosphoenolpyruvate mutase family protein n=1 Tax=Halomarina pelagica TaxID=2961599 RepID=UPI0020C49A5F|nr:isocitrate lyase/phosphoenolpyruvate mutase family protein [Halomarina sp. BND7]